MFEKLKAKFGGKSQQLATETAAVAEVRPVYDEGFDKENNTLIRLVSKRKTTKTYQVTGIDDVSSQNNWKAWIYLFPVIVLIAVFLLYPLVNTIFIAFTKNYKYGTGEFEGMTFENFGVILGFVKYNGVAYETDFTKYAILNTFFLTFITVPVSIFIALIISVALNSIKWFQKILQTVFFLPYVTNAIAVGMVFSVIFAENGVINYLFDLGSKAWIFKADRWTAMFPLSVYIVWHSIPFKILILLSGLQGVDKQYYQAAQIDSCPKWKVLSKITIPLLSPQILYIMIKSFIGAFKEYTSVVGMFNGPGTSKGSYNMETIVFYVYENIVDHTELAAAAAVFLFVIILIFTAIQFAVSKKKVHY